MIRTLFATSIVLLTFAAGCGGATSDSASKQTPSSILASRTSVAAEPTSVAAACVTRHPHAAGDFDQSITSGGAPRTYVLHIPTGYDGVSRTPLVLSLHGYGFDAKQMDGYTKFSTIGDQRDAIVVTPNGNGTPQHWNWRKAPNEPDDVQFTKDLLDKSTADLCVNEDRIFVAGFSDGAAMSRILACELPKRVAAVATVSSPSVLCVAAVPMIAFHGTSDPLIPFEGGVVPPAVGGGGTFPPVRRSVSEWARALGCDGLANISRLGQAVELSTYVHCPFGDGDALLYTEIGAGHTWPGSAPLPVEQFGPTSADIDATTTIWDFFAAHPLAQ